jgi:hypothetical protein
MTLLYRLPHPLVLAQAATKPFAFIRWIPACAGASGRVCSEYP